MKWPIAKGTKYLDTCGRMPYLPYRALPHRPHSDSSVQTGFDRVVLLARCPSGPVWSTQLRGHGLLLVDALLLDE